LPNADPIPLFDLHAQYWPIRDEIRTAVDRVLDSQQFILGAEVEAFERELAAYCGCKHGIGVSSGTDALLISLMAIGLHAEDEVITTPYTFFATAGAIARLGARPVFVDIDPLTYMIDVNQIEAAISDKTRAIIPVHLFGQMADMPAIMEIANRRNLFVIEDAAQAIGAAISDRPVCSFGQLGCLSFFPSKNLGAFGDAGMVVCSDDSLADKLRLLRSHGFRPKYYNRVLGGNFRLDAIQAAILRVKLKYLDDWTVRRQQNARSYQQLFRNAGLSIAGSSASSTRSGALRLPLTRPGLRHVYNQFVVYCGVGQRDQLKTHLMHHRVGSEIYYPLPMHLQECFSYLGYRSGDFLLSEDAAAATLALPIYPELTEPMLKSVVDTVALFYAAATKA